MQVENPFLPLSFIAGPAILTNGCAVLLNGASIRYNLAISLWRDLQAELGGHANATAAPYKDRREALDMAHQRVRLIVRALNLLYAAVAGFGLATLAGLTGGLLAGGEASVVEAAKIATVFAGAFGLICLLAAAVTFLFESRCTIALLQLGRLPKPQHDRPMDHEAV